MPTDANTEEQVPGALEMAWRHRWFRFDDVSIHAVEAGPRGGKTLLFIHGFPDFWYSWRHQVAYFSKHAHVVAIDQRGYNLSSKPAALNKYDINHLIADVVRVIQELEARSIVLIGHDWGGAVSWEVARRFPKLLSKLVIINCPPIDVLFKEVLRNPRQLLASLYIVFFQIPWLPEFLLSWRGGALVKRMLRKMVPGITPRELHAYGRVFSDVATARAGVNYYRAALRHARGHEPAIPRIPIPTRVIWGVDDPALHHGLVPRLSSLVTGEYTGSLLRGGHFIHQEQPATVNKLIKQFVDHPGD